MQDGISAEIMSLANGQHEVAELLNKLRPVCRGFIVDFYLSVYSYAIFCQSFATPVTNDDVLHRYSVKYCMHEISHRIFALNFSTVVVN